MLHPARAMPPRTRASSPTSIVPTGAPSARSARRCSRSRACSARGSTVRAGRRRVVRPRRARGPLPQCSAGAGRHRLAATRLFATSAREYLEQRFRSEHVLARPSVGTRYSNTLAGPGTPGTAYALLHEHAASALGGQDLGIRPGRDGSGHRPACGTPRARRESRSAPIARWIRSRSRKVAGPLRSISFRGRGDLGTTTVLSNADPKRTLARPASAPTTFRIRCSRAAIRAYRSDGASMKINLAVGELPRMDGTPPGAQVHHRGLIQLTLPLAGMDRDQEGARRGIPAPAPHVELCVPSALDPTLAPGAPARPHARRALAALPARGRRLGRRARPRRRPPDRRARRT